MSGLEQKQCEYCSGFFVRSRAHSPRQWAGKRFCSRTCSGRFLGPRTRAAQILRLAQTPREEREAELRVRLLKGIEYDLVGGCWLWAKGLAGSGYGEISFLGKDVLAHRASWRLFRGSIPEGIDVLHTCDTPVCINPSHLFLGDAYDNMRDMAAKGRAAGPYGPLRGLSHAERAAIFDMSRGSRELARTLNIDQRFVNITRATERRRLARLALSSLGGSER